MMKFLAWSRRLLTPKSRLTILSRSGYYAVHVGSSCQERVYPQCSVVVSGLDTPLCRWFSTTDTKKKTSRNNREENLVDPQDEKMFNLLVEFKERNGDCHVPSGSGKSGREERE
jgi:hypothetical protein